jgi:hypothetical protein
VYRCGAIVDTIIVIESNHWGHLVRIAARLRRKVRRQVLLDPEQAAINPILEALRVASMASALSNKLPSVCTYWIA